MGYNGNKIMLRDEHDKKIIGVELKDGRLWCDFCNPSEKKKECMHKWYVMGTLEISSLTDPERKK